MKNKGKKEVSKEKEKTPETKTCPVCYGMGVLEKTNGDTFDCPNRSCKNGYIKNK